MPAVRATRPVRSPGADRRSARRRTPRRGRRPRSRPSSSGTSPPPPASTTCGRNSARTTRSSAAVSGPASATSLTGASWKSIACSRWPNAAGCCGAIACSSAIGRRRGVLVARLARQRGEPQQPERGRRAAGRDRRVLELLAARDQLVVGADGEEAAALGVGEALEDLVRERPRLGEPAVVERRLVERERAPRAGTRGPRGRRGSSRGRGCRSAAGGHRRRAGRARRTPRRPPPRRGSRRARARRRPRRARRSSARSRRSGACRRAPGAPAARARRAGRP